MKIHHHIEVSVADIDSMFESIVSTCLSTYPNTDLQSAAINVMKQECLTWLGSIVNEAFKLGEKVGKAHASDKDNMWYTTEEEA